MSAAYLNAPQAVRVTHHKRCDVKQAHASRQNAIVEGRKQGNHHPYRCRECGMWHNTSQRGTNRK